MNVPAAIVAALRAIASAYAGRHGLPEPSPDARAAMYLNYPRALARQAQAAGETSIDAVALAWLVAEANEARGLRNRLAASEAEADAAFRAVAAARKVLDSKIGDRASRQRDALYELGLLEAEGAKPVDHALIAQHFLALRRGEFWYGRLQAPMPHQAAVEAVEAEYGLAWDSITRACRRKGISLRMPE